MDFFAVFFQMLTLFVLLLVGWLANRLKIMNGEMNRLLSRLVVNITMPAMILASVLDAESVPEAGKILEIMAAAVAGYAVLLAAAVLFPRWIPGTVGEKGVYQFALAFGNVAFIGFPVVTSIFGQGALFYASVFTFPFNILAFTLGILFVARGQEGVRLEWKRLISPALVSAILAVILALLQIPSPPVLGEACSLLGQITTPAALLIIGSSLAEIPFSKMFRRPGVYIVTLLRLGALPVLVWLLFKGWLTDPLLLGISVVLAGMPVATNGTMLCMEYGGDAESMTEVTFLTTVCSVFTIPLLAMLVKI